jgi:RNA polymerase sigma-70 factor, ECF subfamily
MADRVPLSFEDDARRAAEQAARHSYGKLLSILAARNRDIAAAEDALASAFQSALNSWPQTGVPERPEAWLLTAARRTLLHQHRHQSVRNAADYSISLLMEERSMIDDTSFVDRRLHLMFVCTHPAIDPAIQAPLILQTVLGIDAARIAMSFLVEPSAMSQRLVRAKSKIRDAGIDFELPDVAQFSARIEAVLSSIYAAFGTGWDDLILPDGRYQSLAEEAIWLGRVLVQLVPEQPEAKGLLALMLYCHARKNARIGPNGSFIPLGEQDHRLWLKDQIIEAENVLVEASRMGKPGRFQVEAAIQSLHVQRAITQQKNHEMMLGLYGWLAQLAPTLGVIVARAAAHLDAGQAETALTILESVREKGQSYQPWWACLAHAQRSLGDRQAATASFQQAASMSNHEATRAYLLSQSPKAQPSTQ